MRRIDQTLTFWVFPNSFYHLENRFFDCREIYVQGIQILYVEIIIKFHVHSWIKGVAPGDGVAAVGLVLVPQAEPVLVVRRAVRREDAQLGRRALPPEGVEEVEADLPLGRFDIVYVPRSAIGNINQFTKKFFAENMSVLQFGFLGWELFNLDRVFVVAGR